MYLCFMDRDNKTVNINLRVSEKTKANLLKMADFERRSLSDFIRLQLEKLAESTRKK